MFLLWYRNKGHCWMFREVLGYVLCLYGSSFFYKNIYMWYYNHISHIVVETNFQSEEIRECKLKIT